MRIGELHQAMDALTFGDNNDNLIRLDSENVSDDNEAGDFGARLLLVDPEYDRALLRDSITHDVVSAQG